MDRGRAVLVTGASAGIGFELARLFAGDGRVVVAVARDRDRLEAAASELRREHAGQVIVMQADLARLDAVDELVEELGAQGIEVEVLVNNAGVGASGPFVGTGEAATIGMIAVNVMALTLLTRKLLPPMVARGRGSILNVASTAAFQPGPYMAVYYATKAYVLSFSEAIAAELHGTGVRVTTLCPGPTRTGFGARAGMRGSRLSRSRTVMDAAAVARAGHAAVLRGERLVVPGLVNKVVSQAWRFLPRRALTAISGALNRARAPKA